MHRDAILCSVPDEGMTRIEDIRALLQNALADDRSATHCACAEGITFYLDGQGNFEWTPVGRGEGDRLVLRLTPGSGVVPRCKEL